MTVRNRRFLLFVASLLGLTGSLGTASAHAQTIVVTAKSVAELSDGLEHVVSAVAPPDNPMAATVLNMLGQVKSGAMLKGLDRGRLFGLSVTLPKDLGGGEPPSVVAAVPVSNAGQFLDSLKELGLAVDDQPGVAGFSHKVTMPNGNPTFFVVQSKGYALFSLVPKEAERIGAMDPTSWKPKGRPETALSAVIRLPEVPDVLKDQFLTQFQANLNKSNEREPGESDSEYRGRIAGQKVSMDAFKSLIRDGDEIALDLDLNRKISVLALELAVSARPNTPMAQALAALNGRRSRFQALSKEPAMNAWASLPIAKEVRDALSDVFDQATKVALERLQSDEEKKLFTRLGEVIKSTLYGPEIDLGLVVEGTSPTGAGAPGFVMVAGIKTQKGREFEQLIREAAKKINAGDVVKVTFDVAKAADGTAIHQFSAPFGKDDAEVARLFGKGTLNFAFRQDAVLASFGESGLASLRRTIEEFATPHASEGEAPVSAEIRVASLGAFDQKANGELRQAIADVFRGENAKRDRLHLSLKGDGGTLRLRLAVDVPALKVIAVLANQARQ
jgi:hypothetical protein